MMSKLQQLSNAWCMSPTHKRNAEIQSFQHSNANETHNGITLVVYPEQVPLSTGGIAWD